MLKRWMNLAAAAMISVVATGCIGADESAPDLEAGQGEGPPVSSAAYPEGPFGFAEGSILPNLEFLGFPDFVHRGAELRITKLSDFYNPTGAEVFGEELAYYGDGQVVPRNLEGLPMKPRAIVMLISSVWCGPCRTEAANVLPGEYAEWKPQGGHFLAILIDGQDPGTPATVDELSTWASTYNTSYTMAMDPSNHVMAFYEPAFPGNIIIRTSDMKIIRQVAGVPQASFWNTFAQVVAGTYEEPLDGLQ
jgi:hypothetical protein